MSQQIKKRRMTGRGILLSVILVLSNFPDTRPAPIKIGINSPHSATTVPGPRIYFDAAIEAAKWIRSTTMETPKGLIWPNDALEAKTVTPDIESGVAGKVLFFLALHRRHPSGKYLPDIRRGAEHLLANIPAELKPDSFPPGNSFYYGAAGIGFTLYEAYKTTGDKRYRTGALRCVELIHKNARPEGDGVVWTNFNDILFGNAGTGLFLLYVAREMNHAPSRALAIRAGRALLGRGVAEHGGLNWKFRQGADVVLPNFSHGVAGIGYFMATLYAETKQKEFLAAARAAAKYLKAIAKRDGGVFLVPYGWPNPQWKDYYEIGWAHGAAGTARFFFRLWQITKEPAWLEVVKDCARGIMQSGLPGTPKAGFGTQPFRIDMRFGSASAADFLLNLYRHTGDKDYIDFARLVTDDVLKKATVDRLGMRWVFPREAFMSAPGTVAAFTGYFYGSAGYGLLLLRLDATGRRERWKLSLPDDPF